MYINRKKEERDAFGLQNIKKSEAVFLYFVSFYFFYFSRKHCHLFVIHHYIWLSSEIYSVTAQPLQ